MPASKVDETKTSNPAPDGDRAAGRASRRARAFMVAGVALVVCSIGALVACARAEWVGIMPFLMWIHVAVLLVFVGAIFALRKRRPGSGLRVSPRPRELLAPWVLALAAVGAVSAALNWPPTLLGTAPDGSPVFRQSWRESEDGGRYFETVNNGPEREISRADYAARQQGLYGMFARIWLLFSFVAMLMWRAVFLRRRDDMAPARFEPSATSVARTFDSPEGAHGRTSTIVIAAIWILGVGSNVMAFLHPADQAFCMMTAPIVPEPMNWVILLMPVLMFGGGALFTRHSPFMSPWIIGLIDERTGAGSYARFLTRLKPLLLFSASGFVSAAAVAVGCARVNHLDLQPFGPAFMVSLGLAFGAAHAIMRLRRVEGV